MSESESWLTVEEIADELRRVQRDGISLKEDVRYTFSTVTIAARFTRNARGRGYIARRQGNVVAINQEQLDAQMNELLAHYGGMP